MRKCIVLIALTAWTACEAQSRLMVTTVTTVSGSVAPELFQGNDGSLYAATSGGGTFGQGAIIKTTLDGAQTTFVSFDGTNGANPNRMPLETTDGQYYGITLIGGSMGGGTVYRIDANGILSAIHSFDFTNGNYPFDLIMGKDGALYGLTGYGGVGYSGTPNSGNGIAFKVTTNGVFTRLADFNDANSLPGRIVEANDGHFYGVTHSGGIYGAGTVFRMNAQGQLDTVVTFTATNGANPQSLVLGSDGCLYGTAGSGGIDFNGDSGGWGSVFKVTTNGEFTTLRFFSNTDGAWPYGRLLEVSNGVFYGTTYIGGRNDDGTAFQITTNGQFENLIQFEYQYGKSALPVIGLTKGTDGNYYGALTDPSNTIFCLRPLEAPVLQSAVQDGQINLTWHAWGGLDYYIAYKTNLNQTDWQYIGGLISAQTNGLLSCQVPIGAYPQEFIGPDPQRFYSIVLDIPEHWW
jgi:uncharacterized repeat protein (TIGR03803 family)